jgi:hypothetical protein
MNPWVIDVGPYPFLPHDKLSAKIPAPCSGEGQVADTRRALNYWRFELMPRRLVALVILRCYVIDQSIKKMFHLIPINLDFQLK